MPGLFDFLSNEDPNQAAQLAMAAGLLGGRGSFNEILGKSLLAGQAEGQRAGAIKRQASLDELARQRFQLALDEENRKKQAYNAQEKFRASIPEPSALGGVDWSQGPTPAAAAQVKPVDPLEKLKYGALRSGGISPIDYIRSQQKDTTPISVQAGGALVQPGTYKEMYRAPDKAQATPSGIQEWMLAKANGDPGSETFTGWMQAQKRAGASNVSVSTGQKGFQNELDLKKDFRQEPIYKDYQDMQSAYKQIKAGVAAANPVGDLATATKIMKLLDPGSVVRESELGMAMAASGRMDRMKNYIDMQLKGTKLTPTQRQEFSDLADSLYEAAGQSYNQKRSEYEGIGKRYQLDTSGLGTPHKSVQNVAPTGVDPSIWKFMTPEERALWQKN